MVAVLNLINVILLHALLLPTNAFPILYVTRSRVTTSAGRAVVVSTVALALLVDVSIFLRYVEVADPLVAALIVLVVLSLILAGSIYKLAVLLKDQHQARRRQPADD